MEISIQEKTCTFCTSQANPLCSIHTPISSHNVISYHLLSAKPGHCVALHILNVLSELAAPFFQTVDQESGHSRTQEAGEGNSHESGLRDCGSEDPPRDNIMNVFRVSSLLDASRV